MLVRVGDSELLCIVLGLEIGRDLGRYPLELLLEAGASELAAMGVQEAVADRLIALAEIARRYQPSTPGNLPIDRPERAVGLVGVLRSHTSARFGAVLLDNQLRVIDVLFTPEPPEPSNLMAEAVERGTVAMIIARRGEAKQVSIQPSDLACIRKLTRHLVDVRLVDYLVVSPRAWVSCRALGHLHVVL